MFAKKVEKNRTKELSCIAKMGGTTRQSDGTGETGFDGNSYLRPPGRNKGLEANEAPHGKSAGQSKGKK